MRNALLAVALALLVALAGCGGLGGDQDSPTATDAPATTEASESPTETTNAETTEQPRAETERSPTEQPRTGTPTAEPPTETETPESSPTETPEQTPAETETPEPTPTETPTPEPTPTATPTPTETPESSPAPEDPPSDGETDGTLEVHTINVGQGDAALVVGPTGETMLIDSGDWRNDGEEVIAYLEKHDVDRIDYLVTTHPDADHIGGHAAVIDHYETEKDGVGQVWDPGVTSTSQTYDRYLDAVERHDVDLIRAQEGDTIPLEGTDVKLYNPAADSELDDSNDDSIVLRVERGESSFLFTADAERTAESRMVGEYGSELDSDVYLGGHHGSATSSSGEFLDVVDPRAAMLSSAYDSQYGHPSEETLERLAERSIPTYWTGVHGTTVFESDGDAITVRTQADATTDPLELKDEPEATMAPTAATERRTSFDAASGERNAIDAPSTSALGPQWSVA
ncbi:ComEC/Rec2 family competence protein [Halegenticoccus tardaugens]|uniref:ComEC/Rec2 family competence protein n=1 Tax=Halegenticoccus tardaugens TaxID=2071624 RepID=UPI00100AB96F|nr:ComEC/Rec2 family competence protein [Halegenticoccus tardaugens]